MTYKTYTIYNSDNDAFATVRATSKTQAMEIWDRKLWLRNHHARQLRADITADDTPNAPDAPAYLQNGEWVRYDG